MRIKTTIKKSRFKLISLLSLTALILLATNPLWLNFVSAMPANNFFGAIYTSLGDGTAVNHNIYDNKADVYLNGGPQNTNGPGMPNGTYYFQVTNPSGSTLLSTDLASCRQLTVANGVVSGATGPCPHANGTFNPANLSTPVQLIPFNDTPNSGGEYKVWLIRQTSETTVAGDGIHITFDNKDTKTDNFKVRLTTGTPTPTPPANVTYTLSGCKFYDRNANGSWDHFNTPNYPNEVTIPGVRIIVTVNGVDQPYVETGQDGCWSLPGVQQNAEYSVRELVPNTGMEPAFYWVQTAPLPDSMNFQGYSGIADGPFTCNQDNTVCTGQIGDLDFGDVCFGPARGGLTLGYWSNKNGQKTMTTGMVDISTYPVSNPLNLPVADNPNPDSNGMNNDLAFLRRLNLINSSLQKKTGNTSAFSPTNYADFNTWLLNGNAVNMAYMLSVQLSATSLDVRHKSLFDTQIVDATSLGLGYTSIGSVRIAANEELIYINPSDPTITGANTYTGNPLREDEEILKNFLDGVNNNRLPFAQASPCPVVYPAPAP